MSVTDNFNRANGSLGANWTAIKGTWNIITNQGGQDGNTFGPIGAYWSANAWNADQTSALTYINGANSFGGPGVRLTDHGGGNVDGYIYFNNGTVQRISNGANVNLASGTAISSSDTMELDITGTGIVARRNGSTDITTTDSAFASGNAGIGGYGNSQDVRVDDWQGTGEISTAGDTQEWRGCVEDVGVRRRNPISAMYRTIVDWLRPAWWRTTWQMC